MLIFQRFLRNCERRLAGFSSDRFLAARIRYIFSIFGQTPEYARSQPPSIICFMVSLSVDRPVTETGYCPLCSFT